MGRSMAGIYTMTVRGYSFGEGSALCNQDEW